MKVIFVQVHIAGISNRVEVNISNRIHCAVWN